MSCHSWPCQSVFGPRTGPERIAALARTSMDATRSIWTAYGNALERFRSYRTTSDNEVYEDASEDFAEPSYVFNNKERAGTVSRDPFLAFAPDFDFGPECEQFRIRDLGDFSDRFDRTAETSTEEADEEEIPALVDPAPLEPSHVRTHVHLSEPSSLLSDTDCKALASALPVRHRWRRWHLLYSSARDGISLATLYR